MITLKLVNLAKAMTISEGWHANDEAKTNKGNPSVSYRNHNPGNLRFSPFALGVRDGFSYFLNDDIGFFAMLYDLHAKCTGKTQTRLTPQSTIAEMIQIYCCAQGDELENYIKTVELYSALNRSQTLDSIVS